MKQALAAWCMVIMFVSGALVSAQTPEPSIIVLPQTEGDPPAPDSDPEALQIFGDRTSLSPTESALTERRMPLVGANRDAIVRLAGESSAVDLSLFVPATLQATGFQLVLRTSINVLPERSSVTVIVNGAALPAVRPVALDGFVTVPLDNTVLQPGENSVRIESNLFHRIYCGPEASFALWIEVDTSLSGIILPSEYRPEPEDLVHLLAAQSALPQGLSFHVADGVDPQMLGLVTARVLGLRGVRVQGVTIGSPYAPAGATGDLVRIALLPGAESTADVVTGGDGATVLRVRPGSVPEETSIALSSILPTEDALKPTVAVLEPGVATTLGDLGREDAALRGHYILHEVPFQLPANWLVLGPQKGRLTLDYGFAEGLAEGAILLIKLNGITVRLLPLDVDGGDALAPLSIAFLASLLRSGVNVLAFEAIIPGNPPDLPCVNSDGPVLTIKGGSTVLVPASPKMRFPGI